MSDINKIRIGDAFILASLVFVTGVNTLMSLPTTPMYLKYVTAFTYIPGGFLIMLFLLYKYYEIKNRGVPNENINSMRI